MPSDEPVFVGDAVTAAGYRLAGLRVVVPAKDRLAAEVLEARALAQVVLLGASVAARLDPKVLEQVRGGPGVVIVVPDVGGDPPPRDIATRVREQLGGGA